MQLDIRGLVGRGDQQLLRTCELQSNCLLGVDVLSGKSQLRRDSMQCFGKFDSEVWLRTEHRMKVVRDPDCLTVFCFGFGLSAARRMKTAQLDTRNSKVAAMFQPRWRLF